MDVRVIHLLEDSTQRLDETGVRLLNEHKGYSLDKLTEIINIRILIGTLNRIIVEVTPFTTIIGSANHISTNN